MSIAERAAEALDAIRSRQPRIHCLTNTAAHVLTANALLAVGAVPSLTGSPDEVADFARSADGLLVNLGTLDEDRRAAIGLAIDAVQNTGTPWLLDPALCDRSALRARWAVDYARRGPAIVRTNAAEFGTLAGRLDAVSPEEVARRLGSVLVRSGPQDLATDGMRWAMVDNGHHLMGRSTAIGCAGTAVMTAFAAVDNDYYQAAVSALAVFGIAGEIAGERAAGPGSFVPDILDALYRMDGDVIAARVRVS